MRKLKKYLHSEITEQGSHFIFQLGVISSEVLYKQLAFFRIKYML